MIDSASDCLTSNINAQIITGLVEASSPSIAHCRTGSTQRISNNRFTTGLKCRQVMLDARVLGPWFGRHYRLELVFFLFEWPFSCRRDNSQMKGSTNISILVSNCYKPYYLVSKFLFYFKGDRCVTYTESMAGHLSNFHAILSECNILPLPFKWSWQGIFQKICTHMSLAPCWPFKPILGHSH